MKNMLFLLITLAACKPVFDIKKDGGIRIVIEIDSAGLSKEELSAAREESMKVLMKRLDLFSSAVSTIKQGEDSQQIVLELPGKNHDVQRLKKVLQSSARLSFCETYEYKDELYPKMQKLNELLKEQDSIRQENEMPRFELLSPLWVYFSGGQTQLKEGPVAGIANRADTARINAFLQNAEAKKIFGSKVKFLWSFKPVDKLGTHELIAIRTDLNGGVPLSGNIIKEAKKIEGEYGGPQISVKMTEEAAEIWKRLTGRNIGSAIAIVIDEQVFSYPVVQGQIAGGVSSITGNFTQQEADDFVSVLNAGFLPARLSIISEEQVLPQK